MSVINLFSFGKLVLCFTIVFSLLLQWTRSRGLINGDGLTILSKLRSEPFTIRLAEKCCFLICLLTSLVVTYGFYATFVKKLNYCVTPDTGFYAQPHMDRKTAVNVIKRMKDQGDPPPAYGNGWYALIESHRLKKGEALSMNVVGLTLAVFRDDHGVARVIDAHCPHLGTNLGAGGRVRGDCIECPFHGWLFNGEDGRCVKIPNYDDIKIPDLARVTSYNVHEVNAWVHFWYHAEGREPFWTVPEEEDITNGKLTFCGRTEHHAYCHIEDLSENAADSAHLTFVHAPSLINGTDIRYMFDNFWSFVQQELIGSWEECASPNEHLGSQIVVNRLTLFGKVISFIKSEVNVTQVGPALSYVKYESIFGSMIVQNIVNPVEPMLQKVMQNVYASRFVPLFIATRFLIEVTKQQERDLYIWNNKRYASKPVLLKTKEDSLLLRHRRWYSQFYSENSKKVTMKKENGLDW